MSVASGVKTSGIDAALAIGGSINGTVTDEETGAPIEGICVEVFSTRFDASIVTDAVGNYSVGGLDAGDYPVLFSDCQGVGDYSSEWYDDQPRQALADLVSVVVGQEVSGIDSALSRRAATGDANCDGIVNAIDAAFILQFNAGLLASLPCEENADINGDAEINAIDAALILQFTAGLLDSLPP